MSAELPYFDLLLEGRRRQDPAALVFGRFVHWGYWESPPSGVVGDSEFLAAMERLNEQVLAPAELADGQDIVDAGCGFGGTLAGLARRFPSARLWGVNIDARQLAVAKEQARASWLRADACRLPLAPASVDRILAVECIFHFPSRLRFLKEAAAALKPGGRLALSDFVPRRPGSGGPLGRWVEARIRTGYGSLGEDWPDGGYAEMAAAAGLELLTDRDITAHTLPTYPKLRELLRRGEPDLSRRMLWPTRLLELVSRLGAVRYRVLAFRKPPC